MEICTSNKQKNSQVSSARLKKNIYKKRLQKSEWTSRLCICNGLMANTHVLIYSFFTFSEERKFQATESQSNSNQKITMELYFFHFLIVSLDWKKSTLIHTHFWSEPQNIIGTTGWESRSKKEGRWKKYGLANALQDQMRKLLVFLTWYLHIQGDYWCESKIRQSRVSGPTFDKLGLKLRISWGIKLLWFSLD